MRVITDYRTTLSQNITSVQTGIPVSSLYTVDDTPHLITAADFDSYAFLVIEPGGSNQEIISVTGTNLIGFTGGTRGLAFYGPSTASVPGNQKSHQAGSTVILSNVHYYYDELMDLTTAETVTGVKTFDVTTGRPRLSADVDTAIATELVDFGQLSRTSFAGTVNASTTVKGIVQEATVAEVNAGTAIGTTGAVLFASPADLLASNYGTQLPTSNQKAALVGDNTDIAVGAGNKYVTQTGFQKGSEIFAATATGNDTYVATLSPVPISYDNGRRYFLKVDVANTGPSTVNFNSLGAVAIVTGVATATVTGDILANQILELVYNSTGPVFQLVNPASAVLGTHITSITYARGSANKNIADASTTQNIAHSLGATPSHIWLHGAFASTAGISAANSIYVNGASTSTYEYCFNGTSAAVGTGFELHSASADAQTGVITADATNIIITWTKNGTGSGTAQLLYEATLNS